MGGDAGGDRGVAAIFQILLDFRDDILVIGQGVHGLGNASLVHRGALAWATIVSIESSSVAAEISLTIPAPASSAANATPECVVSTDTSAGPPASAFITGMIRRICSAGATRSARAGSIRRRYPADRLHLRSTGAHEQ